MVQVENVSIVGTKISILLLMWNGDSEFQQRMVCPLIPTQPMNVSFCSAAEHLVRVNARHDMLLPAVEKLMRTSLLPEELFHVILDRTEIRSSPLRVVPIHNGAVAVYSEERPVTDVYIFDSAYSRLLRRLHIPRTADRVEMLASGPFMVLVTDTRLTTFAPLESKTIRLRSWHPA